MHTCSCFSTIVFRHNRNIIFWFDVSYPRLLSFVKCSFLLQFNAKIAYQIALLVLNAHISENGLNLRQIIKGTI